MQTGRDVAESHREAAASGRRGRTADLPGRRGGTAAGSEVIQHHREENPGKDASTEEQLRDACRV